MVILDTDHMSLLEWRENQQAMALRERLADVDPQDVATTVISYEQQFRGWMTYLARAKTIARQVEAYRRLVRHLENYRQIAVLPFDDKAAATFQHLRESRIR